MVYKYEENSQLRIKLRENNLKNSEIYQKQKRVHPLWWLGTIIIGISGRFILGPGNNILLDVVGMLMFATIPGAVAIAITVKQRGSAYAGMVWSFHDVIVVEESGFRSYWRDVTLQDSMYGDGIRMYYIPYKDIKRITYNSYYDYLRIYAEANVTIFKNFKKQQVYAEKGEMDVTDLYFYLFYDKKEELLEKLEELSGIVIERSNDPKEHEQMIKTEMQRKEKEV